MTIETRTMTAEELAALPHDACYELVKGLLRKKPFAGFEHGVIAHELAFSLNTYGEARQLGIICAAGTGFQITSSPDTVLAPDVAFVRQAQVAARGRPKGYWPGVPDLVAEVVSPNDSYTEVTEKAAAWITAGAQLVLVIDPGPQTVTVYRSLTDIAVLREQDVLDGAPVLPGWTLPVRELFS